MDATRSACREKPYGGVEPTGATPAANGSGFGATWKAARSAASRASAAAMTKSLWPYAASKRNWPRAPGLRTNSARFPLLGELAAVLEGNSRNY